MTEPSPKARLAPTPVTTAAAHGTRRVRWPGALLGSTTWLGAAAVLSYTLRSAGRLTVVHGGVAGLVPTPVFLGVSAVIPIFGAEINGVLRRHGPPRPAPSRPTPEPMPTSSESFVTYVAKRR